MISKLTYKQEIDNGDTTTEDEVESGDEYGAKGKKRKQAKKRARPSRRRTNAVDPDNSDSEEESDDARAHRKTASVMSKAAQQAKENVNPYMNDRALQASVIGIRNEILYLNAPDDRERAAILADSYDPDLPRGQLPANGDFDQYMRFPPPEPAMTAQQKKNVAKMRLMAEALRKNREAAEQFPEVRMEFHSDIIAPDIIAAEIANGYAVAPVESEDAAYQYPQGRGSKPRVHKKLGSRSKLGPLQPKRNYNWKDPTKEASRAKTQAKKMAAAILADNVAPPKAPLPRKKGGKIDRYPKREE